ncbi:MAG: hypothetical protein NT163_08410 [Chlorobiales bacterium]|nr:hypothetical protein [Chlorobiales bacterium]
MAIFGLDIPVIVEGLQLPDYELMISVEKTLQLKLKKQFALQGASS